MIRHVVFFSARAGEDAEHVRDGLMMLRDIPHVRHFEVGRNLQSDQLSDRRVDLVVYAEFEDEAALAAYKAHPLYAECVARVRPLRELRLAADFEADAVG